VFGFVEAINIVLAQRILALMDAGVLQIKALGEHPTVSPLATPERFRIKGDGVSLTAPYFIDCTGQKLSLEHSTSLLLKNLLNKGVIQSAQIPFRSQNTEINYSPHKERGVVKQIADHQVYCSGGIFVDPHTLRVIPSQAFPKCYATLNHWAISYLSWVVWNTFWCQKDCARYFGESIVGTLLTYPTVLTILLDNNL